VASDRLDVDGKKLVDGEGREVLLRGVNAGGRSKFPPFLPFPFEESGYPGQEDEPPFEDALASYVDRIASWGHDVVRVPFSWEGLEPERGNYDAVYLQRYRAILFALDERGIRSIVDFHQDVFARPYCGDGFPLWTIPEAPIPPPEDCETWFTGYLGDPDVDAAFDRLWANDDGIRDALVDMWEHVTEETSDIPGVIGYEIINEPHHGTEDKEAWATTTLPDFYEEVAAAILAIRPDALVLLDGAGTDASTQTTLLVPPEIDRFVFAPHYYNPQVFMFGADEADYDTEADLEGWAAVREQWNVPVLVGEFGAETDNPGTADYIAATFDALDHHLLHGTAWEYSTTEDDWNNEGLGLVEYGGIERPAAQSVVRPYPEAIAGELKSVAFDRDAMELTLEIDAEPGGVHRIRVPERLFPDGVDVEGADCVDQHDGLVDTSWPEGGLRTLTIRG